MVGLSNTVIVKSRRNWRLYGHLMVLFDVHQKTIETWIKENDPRLANPSAVKIFSQQLGIPANEVLEETVDA